MEENKTDEEKKTEKQLEKAEETTKQVDKLNDASQRLEAANKEQKRLADEQKAKDVETTIAGEANAGEGGKEETPKEYADRIIAGDVQNDEGKNTPT